MAAITATVTAITEMVRGPMEYFPLNEIVGQTTLNSVRRLIERLTTFESHFTTTKWGSKNGFLPLVFSETKMRLATGDNNLDCERLANTELIKPKIEDNTEGS